MLHRFLAALPLLLAVVGCVDEPHSLLVPPTSTLPRSTALHVPVSSKQVAANEASAKRVGAVGHKLTDANAKIGLRPVFATVGSPNPEIFHKGGGTRGYQVFISDGLVKRCTSDDQLAAVLAVELGKIVAERQSMFGPTDRDQPRLPPIESIGHDSGGAFGPSDGTHMMEQARFEASRRKLAKPAAPLVPQTLAKAYLQKAGYDPAVLKEVAPLLRKAEEHYDVEKSLKTAEIGSPMNPSKK